MTKHLLPSSAQSTNHILLVEPATFYANPQTMDSNVYQQQTHESPADIFQKAQREFFGFQQMLTQNGVAVTVVRGEENCPDSIFPNWISTHILDGGNAGIVKYPMLNENRRLERSERMMNFFARHYQTVLDLSGYEAESLPLEANGSLCLDRVNNVAYATRSPRTNEAVAQTWAEETGYALVLFDTQSHTGKPVYHTDLVMWIGTGVAAICAEAIADKAHRQGVLEKLGQTHQVVELSLEQMKNFCGNALEVQTLTGEKVLVMSEAAHQALMPAQKDVFSTYFSKLLSSPIPTIEQHGGGSARCLMMELF